jgi:hypothetical protein
VRELTSKERAFFEGLFSRGPLRLDQLAFTVHCGLGFTLAELEQIQSEFTEETR